MGCRLGLGAQLVDPRKYYGRRDEESGRAVPHIVIEAHVVAAVSLPLAQSEGRGLGADGTKSGNDANDEMGAKAHGAEPRLVW